MDKNGRVWLAFDHVIQSFRPYNDLWKTYNSSSHSIFSQEDLINIETDNDNNLWAAFPSGLIRINSNALAFFDIEPYVYPTSQYPFSNTEYEDITYVGIEYDGRVRVGMTGYQGFINMDAGYVFFNNAYDISGIIYFEAEDRYWWGKGSFLTYREGNPYAGTNTSYSNASINISDQLRKNPYHFDRNNNLWLLHEGGFSILWRNPSPNDCTEIVPPVPPIINSNSLIFLPNPNQGIFDIVIQDLDISNAEVTIFRSDGRLVFETQMIENRKSIDVHFLKSGIYFVKIKQGDWFLTEQLVIF